MSEGSLSSLCGPFLSELNKRTSLNHQDHEFYANGTTKEVFQLDKDKLRELLGMILHIPSNDTTLLPSIVETTLTNLCNILATLISIKDPTEVLERFRDLLPELSTLDPKDRISDVDLPITLETAKRIFSFTEAAAEFDRIQRKFCPVTLKKWKQVTYTGERKRCRLPYLEEKQIGMGSFGRVWKVKIERHQVESNDGNANSQAVYYARKDFELIEQGFREDEVQRRIRNQVKRHENVVIALASLQYDNTYSLFFHLASCNLWEYLNESTVHADAPSTLAERRSFFLRGATLAGALAFLHSEFRSTTLERLSCYHLDLKPHNILVYGINTPDEKWKITDFGLSRVRGRDIENNEEVDLALPLLRRTRKARPAQDPSTVAHHREGTYLAPECASSTGRVSSASDIWSFGCIFSLVMSFMDSGPHGVKEFKQLRGKQEVGDFFYLIRRGKPQLSPFVADWFEILNTRARMRGIPGEIEVISETLDFLREEVLHPVRDSRVNALKVEDRLVTISRLFHHRPPDTPRRQSFRKRFKQWLASHPTKAPELHTLPVGRDVLGSMFSPTGKFLLYYSRHQMLVFVVDQIRTARQNHERCPDPFVFPEIRGPWDCFAISSKYLGASPKPGNAHHFECYIYNLPFLSSADNRYDMDGKRIYYPNAGSIKKIAMTCDGNLMAFVVTRSSFGRKFDAAVYLFYTQDLLGVGPDEHSSQSSIRSGSNASSTASEATFGGNNFGLQNANIGSIEHIRSLAFSGDGRYLILVVQSQHGEFLVRAWETYTGTTCPALQIPYPGLSNSDRATFTGSCVYNTGPNLVLLLQCKELISLNLWDRNAPRQKLSEEMIAVFMQDDDRALIFLGNNGTDRILRVFMLPHFEDDHITHPTEVAKTRLSAYKPSTDSAVLTDRNAHDQRELLIATIDGSFVTVSLPSTGHAIM
ncbi:hypothetical protein ASPZODRAFT_2040225 [Penicilliopsis zonata CBS 506.65]|uniref:Protein kinase domain-containing protein n=1 Tax=Penicilliopsis zonata CBS 506.65 TaxID=1073090 RepID=A0A1L9SG33_9EURO|nr:hypothetical protein ASPZODRAFT_2040225 [Penicilliopsis zonata CBS 506.65]OJJ46047.1 hypothetical protein ASPZODRAFT_2040225 [Penicilliopsis zonata CBS 506.65]